MNVLNNIIKGEFYMCYEIQQHRSVTIWFKY